MSRTTRQIFLMITVLLFGTMFIAAISNLHVLRDPRPPRDIEGMATWLARHPADWITASALSDAALDSMFPRRFELWRKAHELGAHLAPLRPNATVAFVRGGLFHWYELSEADRAAVLAEAAPLLRDPAIFSDLHAPLWRLTRDFAYLRSNAPPTLDAVDQLRTLAAKYGQFAEYRELRAALQRKRLEIFQQQHATMSLEAMLRLLPRAPDVGDEPLLRAVLEELQRRSFAVSELRGLEPLVLYALRHDLRPLDGLAPLVRIRDAMPAPARARLALALNESSAASAIELGGAVVGAPEWTAYHAERALFEARRGDRGGTLAQLNKAMIPKPTLAALAAGKEAMTLLGDTDAAASYRAQLAAWNERRWRNACGGVELCDWVTMDVYTAGGRVPVTLAPSQTDQTPPYVEIYVDDRLVLEGEVRDMRTFDVPVPDGVHEIEIRLANERTRNGVQRRVRLS
jgi:hypothetical protein